MEQKQIVLGVTAVTVLFNILLAVTGVSASVSCTVASLTATAYASVIGTTTPN